MARRWKWISASVVSLAIVIALGLWIAYVIVLPWVVRREVNAAFARVGLSNVRFDVRNATLWGTDLADVHTEEAGGLRVGNISVRYEPMGALRGRIESIRVTGARLIVDLEHPPRPDEPSGAEPSAHPDTMEFPIGRIDLESCELVLARRDGELKLPVDGSLVRRAADSIDVEIVSAIAASTLSVSGTIAPAEGSAEIVAKADGVDVASLLNLVGPDIRRTVQSAGGRVDANLGYRYSDDGSLATLHVQLNDVWIQSHPELAIVISDLDGSIFFDDLLAPSTSAGQAITAQRITLGEQELTNLTVLFHLLHSGELHVQQVGFNWAGGEVSADAFEFDPSDPLFDTTVHLQRVGMREALALLTDGKATGQGSVSGALPIRVERAQLVSGEPVLRFDIGEGSLRADQPGNLRLGQATDDFARLLERSNPDFARDPLLRQVRDDALEAMQDFDFQLLDARFRRHNDELTVAMRIHGRGRTGARLPINLGINIIGADDALNAYLAARARVFHRVSGKASP